MVTVDELRHSGWSIPENLLNDMSEYEQDFMRLEFTGSRTIEYYRNRIQYLGFTGMERVLDAGCGMGQWALALSEYNSFVEGVDLNEGRINVGRRIVEESRAENINLRPGSIEALPFPSAHFDGIFCYGVFMFTDMPKTLSEFGRVLRPGGKLYVNANSYGWYIHLLRDVPWNRRPALGIIKNTVLRKNRAIIVGEPWLRAQLDRAGFNTVMVASEGDASFRTGAIEQPKPEPGYQRKYWGVRAILETVAVKRG